MIIKKRIFGIQDMGDPISFEDVISILTVIFVLFFLFMVPIVNIDKARTEKARIDPYWIYLAGWLGSHPEDSPRKAHYQFTLGIEDNQVLTSETNDGLLRYIEAISPDSNITIVAHNLGNDSYISMQVQDKGGVIVYRSGQFRWSNKDTEWFSVNDRIIYGHHEESINMLRDYRTWTKQQRGF
ncbi:MAG: hypothetical protein HQK83_12025 [Fibrobacteria bacterium]|nr:hypothetical protein [Fibrobacteria bacterium]